MFNLSINSTVVERSILPGFQPVRKLCHASPAKGLPSVIRAKPLNSRRPRSIHQLHHQNGS